MTERKTNGYMGFLEEIFYDNPFYNENTSSIFFDGKEYEKIKIRKKEIREKKLVINNNFNEN